MHIKILMAGNDPEALVADGQLLRDRNMLVHMVFNLENIPELINEVKPDILFFDSPKKSNQITEAYNKIVNSICFKDIPVIFNLSEDDMYLVTRKRTGNNEQQKYTADNIIDAIKSALTVDRSHYHKQKHAAKENELQPLVLQLPVYC